MVKTLKIADCHGFVNVGDVHQKHNIGFRICRVVRSKCAIFFTTFKSVDTQKIDLFGETVFFYPVANTFSQTGCQIPVTSDSKAYS